MSLPLCSGILVGRQLIAHTIQRASARSSANSSARTARKREEDRYTGAAPQPRGGHTLTQVGAQLFVYGGANQEDLRASRARARWRAAGLSMCVA